MDFRPWLILLVMLSASLSGCLGEDDAIDSMLDEMDIYPEPWDRADLQYEDNETFSRVTMAGLYEIGEVRREFLALEYDRADM